jgi:hypothetical protein
MRVRLLLATLSDRDRLGLDLPAALDRKADRMGMTFARHHSGMRQFAQAHRSGN